jgi:hypothetical protein
MNTSSVHSKAGLHGPLSLAGQSVSECPEMRLNSLIGPPEMAWRSSRDLSYVIQSRPWTAVLSICHRSPVRGERHLRLDGTYGTSERNGDYNDVRDYPLWAPSSRFTLGGSTEPMLNSPFTMTGVKTTDKVRGQRMTSTAHGHLPRFCLW